MSPESHPSRRFRPVRYVTATLAGALWVMVFAQHVPIRRFFPDIELFFYPSFVFFMPLSIFFGRMLPWPVTNGWGLSGFLFLDTLLMACVCLPFLFPKGKTQDILGGVSLALAAGYTVLAVYSYLLRSY